MNAIRWRWIRVRKMWRLTVILNGKIAYQTHCANQAQTTEETNFIAKTWRFPCQ